MENIVIRKATTADLPVLLRFEQGIVKAERPFDPTLDSDPISYYDLGELIASAKAEVLVAECNDEIVASGFAKIKKAKPYLDHEDYSYLGFMFTRPEFRGKGINQKIVKALRQWSFEKGLKEIRLTVYEDNVGAVKAYEKVGFKKHLVEMRLIQ